MDNLEYLHKHKGEVLERILLVLYPEIDFADAQYDGSVVGFTLSNGRMNHVVMFNPLGYPHNQPNKAQLYDLILWYKAWLYSCSKALSESERARLLMKSMESSERLILLVLKAMDIDYYGRKNYLKRKEAFSG